MSLLKEKMVVCFKQEWFSHIRDSSSLILYKCIKSSLCFEEYLNTSPISLCSHLCRLRTSAHSLRIQTGRFSNNRTPRNERVYLLCNMNEVEDEFHFMFICPKYSILRRKYIDNYYFRSPSMYKLVELFIKQEKRIILNVAHYIESALSVRFHFLCN